MEDTTPAGQGRHNLSDKYATLPIDTEAVRVYDKRKHFLMNKLPDSHWMNIALKLAESIDRRKVPVKIRDVMEACRSSSTNTAYYALVQMEKAGLVERVQNGSKSEWYLL